MGKRRYTDEQLREAVARSSCITDVLRELGMCLCGDNRERIRRLIGELEVDISHFRKTVRAHSIEELKAAVAAASSMADVCRGLGLIPAGSNYVTLRQEIERLNLDTSHFGIRRRRALPVSDEQLREIVASSSTMSEIVRKAGLAPLGASHQVLQRHIRRLGLDTSHIVRGRWAGPSIEESLVVGRVISTHRLRQRLIREGLKAHRCENCGRTRWMNRPIPLELDHINGDRTDNRIENLRLLCPNCHAMTETYRGKNKGRRA